jgi:hypothetical protein
MEFLVILNVEEVRPVDIYSKSLIGLLMALLGLAPYFTAQAIDNAARVPILLYHSWAITGCTESTNESKALEADLEVIHQNGYTVVPVYWIAQWAIGDRDGSEFPDDNKIVGLTFDDGYRQDWYDTNPNGCFTKSFYRILQEFKNSHPELPANSPHASSFVIASPVARNIIGGSNLSDEWWYAAHHSGLMEIYNHSLDHDHTTIQGPILDSEPHFVANPPFTQGVNISAGGYYNGIWAGQGNFQSIMNFNAAYAEVILAGEYIEDKIGVHPDLFAYPYGGYTAYLANTFFPTFPALHTTYAAFGTDPVYVTRTSNRYTLGRFVRGRDWNNAAELEQILNPPPGC